MPPRKLSPQEIADQARLAALGRRIPQSDIPAIRAAHAQDVLKYYGVLDDAGQAEYDAIMARAEARIDAETRTPEEIFTTADNRRMRALQLLPKRDAAQNAEIEALLAAWDLAYAVSIRPRAK